jgi:hypothetical protein
MTGMGVRKVCEKKLQKQDKVVRFNEQGKMLVSEIELKIV